MEANSELWEQLDQFTDLIESTGKQLSDEDLLSLQAKAENIHEQMENYFNRKQQRSEIFGYAEKTVPPGGHMLPELALCL